MSIEMVEFIYSDDVTVISKPQFEAHMNLYKGYINKYNEIEEKLTTNPETESANATYSHFRGLKRGESYALDGVILHELYFENIGGQDEDLKGEYDNLINAINEYFGTFDQWKEDFIATAKASRGWAVFCFDQRTKTLKNSSLDAHDLGNLVLSFPILVLDVYEHAYFLDYADNKGEYIDHFMKNINWDIIQNRINKINF